MDVSCSAAASGRARPHRQPHSFRRDFLRTVVTTGSQEHRRRPTIRRRRAIAPPPRHFPVTLGELHDTLYVFHEPLSNTKPSLAQWSALISVHTRIREIPSSNHPSRSISLPFFDFSLRLTGGPHLSATRSSQLRRKFPLTAFRPF